MRGTSWQHGLLPPLDELRSLVLWQHDNPLERSLAVVVSLLLRGAVAIQQARVVGVEVVEHEVTAAACAVSRVDRLDCVAERHGVTHFVGMYLRPNLSSMRNT